MSRASRSTFTGFSRGRALVAAACLTLALSSPLGAQPFEFLGWGVQGGLNRGYIDYAGSLEGLDPGWGTGFTASPFLELSLAGRVRLQPGARYAHLENHSTVDMAHSKGEAEIVLDCVSLPVLVKGSIGRGPSFFVIAGLEPGFICKAETRARLQTGESSDDIGDHVNRIYVTLDAGAGFAFDAGGHELFVQGLYCHGISNVADERYWILDWKTREIAVTAGVAF